LSGSCSPRTTDGARLIASVDWQTGELTFEDDAPIDKPLCFHHCSPWSEFSRSANDNQAGRRGNCAAKLDVIDAAERHEFGILLDGTRIVGRHLRRGFDHENARKDRTPRQMSPAPPFVGPDVAVGDENMLLFVDVQNSVDRLKFKSLRENAVD